MKISKLLIFLVSLLLLTCTNKNEKTIDKTFMVICFDVEDYTSPESVGMDDIPKWLAETMTEEGVTGSFFVIGEKARSIAERGRTDVIEAMAKHDIGSHTNYGSIHPTVTEILEHATWEEGTHTMLQNETQAAWPCRPSRAWRRLRLLPDLPVACSPHRPPPPATDPRW